MSQQVSTAATVPTPAPSSAVAAAETSSATAPAPSGTPVRSDTPRRLRRLSTALVWVGVLFGLSGLVTFTLLSLSLSRADDSTAQLVRVQQIQISLLSADANATNAFLVGGLEPPTQRAAYDQAIAAATQLITEAAREEPADSAALSALNTELVIYTATVAQARSANRQGFPVGAQYLRSASAALRADTLPILNNLVAANSARASSQMGGVGEAAVFAIVGVGALAALVLAQIWLAHRFRRTLNVGLVAASAVALVMLVAGIIGLGTLAVKLRNLEAGAFADVNSSAQARIQAYNAKSNESLTLIARGSGGSFEEAWKTSAEQVQGLLTGLDADLSTPWQGYVEVHSQIRALDDAGKWDQAVDLATDTTSPDGSNGRFAAFDEQASAYVDQVSERTSTGLGDSSVWLVLGAVASGVAGIAIAVLARRGVAARLREYR